VRGERLRQAKKRARRVLRTWRSTSTAQWERNRYGEDPYADDAPIERRMRATRCPCSCVGCGNQRRWEGPTRQERKADEDMAAEFAAWDRLSDKASAAFDRWLEDDDDQTFWKMAREDAWVDSASGGETNESHAGSARVRV